MSSSWMACEMFVNGYTAAAFWGAAFRICSKQSSILVSFPPSFFFRWCIHTVVVIQPQFGRNLIVFHQRLDFHIDNLSIAIHAFLMCSLTSLSVDEILLPRYVNWSTNFRGLPLQMEMTPLCLKCINSLFAFMLRPFAACSKLGSRDSAWAGVFARSSRSSA